MESKEIFDEFDKTYSLVSSSFDEIPQVLRGEISVLGACMSEIQDRFLAMQKFIDAYKEWKHYDRSSNKSWAASTSNRLEAKVNKIFKGLNNET